MRGHQAQESGANRNQQEDSIGRRGNGRGRDQKIGTRLSQSRPADGCAQSTDSYEGQDTAQGSDQAGEKATAQETTLDRASDKTVIGADEVQNFNNGAVRVENGTGSENHE